MSYQIADVRTVLWGKLCRIDQSGYLVFCTVSANTATGIEKKQGWALLFLNGLGRLRESESTVRVWSRPRFTMYNERRRDCSRGKRALKSVRFFCTYRQSGAGHWDAFW